MQHGHDRHHLPLKQSGAGDSGGKVVSESGKGEAESLSGCGT
jgi:hypothetical protein